MKTKVFVIGKKQKKFFFGFFNERNQGGSYEVVFISALWMVSSESWKRGCPN